MGVAGPHDCYVTKTGLWSLQNCKNESCSGITTLYATKESIELKKPSLNISITCNVSTCGVCQKQKKPASPDSLNFQLMAYQKHLVRFKAPPDVQRSLSQVWALTFIAATTVSIAACIAVSGKVAVEVNSRYLKHPHEHKYSTPILYLSPATTDKTDAYKITCCKHNPLTNSYH